MLIDLELSAVLSIKNTDYDLFLLRWEIYRLKNGKILNENPEIREFGSVIKASIKKGDYAIIYQLGATTGEHCLSLNEETSFNKQFDLNSGVINVKVASSKKAKPHPDGLVLCRQPSRELQTKWLNVSYPIAVISGEDLILPADIEFALEGQINEEDPELHSEEHLVKLKPGENQSITLIADKTSYF